MYQRRFLGYTPRQLKGIGIGILLTGAALYVTFKDNGLIDSLLQEQHEIRIKENERSLDSLLP